MASRILPLKVIKRQPDAQDSQQVAQMMLSVLCVCVFHERVAFMQLKLTILSKGEKLRIHADSLKILAEGSLDHIADRTAVEAASAKSIGKKRDRRRVR
jgi:hypothetical protein